jgi:acylphosphatase
MDNQPFELPAQRRLSIEIHGAVQGVGFRPFVYRLAHQHGITGWVRNRRDGTVEAEVEGTEDRIDEVLAWMAEGPPGSAVTSARVTELDATGSGAPFEVRGDA